jgi:hypothetical protein
VLQNQDGALSQDQVNRLSVLIRASNLDKRDDDSTKDSSNWNNQIGSHDSRFILKPFKFESQAIMSQRASRECRSTKAPDYTSEEGEICSPVLSRRS